MTLRSLPPELLDLIVDYSCDQQATLRACCLVSRSWVPRARRHLFAHVVFDSDGCSSDIEPWMEAFPDPSNSPAHYARSLAIHGLTAVTAATTHGHPWVRSFHYIVKLAVDTHWWDDGEVSLVRLHGLSPTLKSLSVYRTALPLSEALNLTCSFPLLEDLSLCSFILQRRQIRCPMDPPSTSPKLTGSLLLNGDALAIAHWLLDLPGGLRFSRISMGCPDEFFNPAMNIVSRCSDTLESLYLSSCPSGIKTPLDLSKVTKLKDVEFRLHRPEPQWTITSLRTAQSQNLRQITITIDSLVAFIGPVGEVIHHQWRDLDRLLVQLWTSRSIIPKVRYERRNRRDDMGDLAPSLLPELASRGAVSVVE